MSTTQSTRTTENDATPTRANEAVEDGLACILADTWLLMGKTQACHWNVTGPNFHALHVLFEAQYTELFAAVDTIAERIRALGARAPAGVGAMLASATLSEPDRLADATAMLRMLQEDHGRISAAAARMARDIGEYDPATHDLLVARVAAHDKAAWMLRSHLS